MTTERTYQENGDTSDASNAMMTVVPMMMGIMMMGIMMSMMQGGVVYGDGEVPVVPAGEVHIRIKNPPSGAELWSAALVDSAITYPLNFVGSEYQQHVDITGETIFIVPEGMLYPLRVMYLQIVKWNAAHTAYTVLYEIQSIRPYKYDFSIGGYGTEPDPTYRDVGIAAPGNWYYNVSTEEFESV
jgi:hypothetical protein